MRLLTLTGPGGVGKTRLAIRVASSVAAEYPDGVGFVPLSAFRDPNLLVPTLARALGARPDERDPPLDPILAALQGRRCLLVLDNFEQIASAAPLLGAILNASPDLTLLVTSRTPLHITGEREFPVPPLSLKPGDGEPRLAVSESVRLFADRAVAVWPGFALTDANAPAVAEICARLDGLPLAIELAAHQVRILPPAALLARLEHRLPLLGGGPRDAPDRQRTMRGAIAWSYDLLSPADQAFFRRLSVFVGGFSLAAAESLSPSVLHQLGNLVDHSLIRPVETGDDDPHFLMLETIREFGLEQLASNGEESSARNHHAHYFLALAEQAESHLFGPEQVRWRTLLGHAQDNLRAALTWFSATGAAVEELRLASALVFLWATGSRFAEGRRWLEGGLDRAPDAPAPVRAKALLALGFLAHYRGDEAAAIETLDQGLALARPDGASFNLAFGHFARGIVAEDTGDYPGAVELLPEAVSLFHVIGEPAFAELAQLHLGIVLFGRGDLAEADAAIGESLDQLRALGCEMTVAATADFHGLVAFARNHPADAVSRYRDALTLTTRLRTPEGVARGLAGAATLAAGVGATNPAARWLGAAEAASELSGYASALPERAVFERTTASVRTALGERDFVEAHAAGRALSPDLALAEAIAWLSKDPLAGTAVGDRGGTGVDALSPRERQVLRLLALGKSNKAIADDLFLSPATVKRHVTNILAKLDAPTRAAAISYALRLERDAAPTPRR